MRPPTFALMLTSVASIVPEADISRSSERVQPARTAMRMAQASCFIVPSLFSTSAPFADCNQEQGMLKRNFLFCFSKLANFLALVKGAWELSEDILTLNI